MLLCDTHVHTKFSSDGRSSCDEIAAAAVGRGLDVVCFTDHFDVMTTQPFGTFYGLGNRLATYDEPAVRQGVGDFIENYRGKVKFLRGVELGHPHFIPDKTADFIRRGDFDFILGSLHNLPGDLDIYVLDYSPENVRDYITTYFDQLLLMVKSGMVDSLAHIDYPFRYIGKNGVSADMSDYKEQVCEILRELAQAGLALELNASSMRHTGRFTPGAWVYRAFAGYGGRYVTFGSDAHGAEQVGAYIADAMAYVKSCGVARGAYFEKRRPVEYAL